MEAQAQVFLDLISYAAIFFEIANASEAAPV